KKKKVSWRTIFTTTDVTVHPELADYYAISEQDTLNLLERHGITLQVEDEYYDWVMPPEHYTQMGSSYEQLKSKIPLMIDVNIVELPFAHRMPTAQPTGTELFQVFKRASEQG